jgi:hypothetical protein
MDLLYVILALAFFASSWGLLWLCEWLMEGAS